MLQPQQSWRLLTLFEYCTIVYLYEIAQTFDGHQTRFHYRIEYELEV